MISLAEIVCLEQIFRLTVRCRNAQFVSGLVIETALANTAELFMGQTLVPC